MEGRRQRPEDMIRGVRGKQGVMRDEEELNLTVLACWRMNQRARLRWPPWTLMSFVMLLNPSLNPRWSGD